ncbi:MAG TPA: aminotransferase class I/II-fold pyridoxal phosphate-dependent enzyme, partial [Anaerolineae bacterium]|nr:aminotransferase class I/II-fold pyridoxal phosphate-dependent enzyme [Anaerolineae bacterium]
MAITKAVIAAAGLGTRFLPASKAVPKEMLPLLDRPILQHVVEEAVNSGITDKEDHASIVDGCRLSFGQMKRFRHNDMASLEGNLQACDEDQGKLVVVDGVFSMGGDIAPLPEIISLCKKYKARLMVDDA